MGEAKTATYTEFQFGFVIAALVIALTAGFGYAAVLAASIGLQFSVGNWWAAMLQSHGHAQLMGWTGLFIIGVSLYFVPRLAGTPLKHPNLLPWTLFLLSAGILLRVICQPLLALSDSNGSGLILRVLLVLSALAEIGGVAAYLALLIGTLRGVAERRRAFQAVRIFFLLSVSGWVCHTAIVSCLTLNAAYRGVPLVSMGWNRLASDLFISLVLIPVAMAVSARTFPLYLRLPPIDWHVQNVGLVYLTSLLLQHATTVAQLSGHFVDHAVELRLIGSTGFCLKGSALIYFTWKLDLHLRRRPQWTVNRIGKPGPERRPTRPGLPDYGEFGPFELLLYGAYTGLAFAAILELITGVYGLAGLASFADPDAIRHTYLTGFISLLILGMAPRMVPGFLHKRRVAYPRMVLHTFWMAVTTAVFRVTPLLLADVLEEVPWGLAGARISFGFSGILGWSAVALLALNLLATWRLEPDERGES